MKNLTMSKKGDGAHMVSIVRVLVNQPVQGLVGGQQGEQQDQSQTKHCRRDFGRLNKAKTWPLKLQIICN